MTEIQVSAVLENRDVPLPLADPRELLPHPKRGYQIPFPNPISQDVFLQVSWRELWAVWTAGPMGRGHRLKGTCRVVPIIVYRRRWTIGTWCQLYFLEDGPPRDWNRIGKRICDFRFLTLFRRIDLYFSQSWFILTCLNYFSSCSLCKIRGSTAMCRPCDTSPTNFYPAWEDWLPRWPWKLCH